MSVTKPVDRLYRAILATFEPVMKVWAHTSVSGAENLPREGGYIVAPNHISNVDPICVAYALLLQDVPLRFMAKTELFRVPVLGSVMRHLHMISVDRRSTDPGGALELARQALVDGECVVVYPEGTLTRDPQYWPMKMKTGAARLALDTGVPVIPVAQWGAQEMMPRHSKIIDPKPGHDVHVTFLPPVDASDLVSEKGSEDHEAVNELTRRLEQALVSGVVELRGETPPVELWDPGLTRGPEKKKRGHFSKWGRSLGRRIRARAPEVRPPRE